MSELYGRTVPRIHTPVLASGLPGPCGCGCPLTSSTSLGFEFAKFCSEVVGMELLPYQRWLAVHALELRPDGTFRFRQILVLISRQNGKTAFIKLLSLFLLFTGRAQLILGTAQSLDIAREAWTGACELAEAEPDLAAEIANVRYANGEQCLTLSSGARYRISAATRSAGRGLSVDALVMDELREQRDFAAWGALTKTTTARPNALILCLSNAGDSESVVLNNLRASALAGSSDTVGIFEWSAPDGCALDDPDAWCQANPALGYTIQPDVIRSALATDPPAVFRTETLCQRVEAMDSAIDTAAWAQCSDPSGSLSDQRSRLGLCLDVSPDGYHVTLAAAALLADGRVRVEVIEAWDSVANARAELSKLIAKLGAKDICWFPGGPAAQLAGELRDLKATEVKGADVQEACMEFASLVESRRILHPSDALLDAHVAGVSKLPSGDGWRFSRRGGGHCDAVYAAAGAVRLVRNLPEHKPKSKVFFV